MIKLANLNSSLEGQFQTKIQYRLKGRLDHSLWCQLRSLHLSIKLETLLKAKIDSPLMDQLNTQLRRQLNNQLKESLRYD